MSGGALRRTGAVTAVLVIALLSASGSRALTHSGSGVGPFSPRGLDALPFPGTPDAAPGTHIDFPAVSPAQLASVSVMGSRSGHHAGRLSAQPTGQGAAFSPYEPFSPGEQVTVVATFRSPAAGTASGAPGRKQVRFVFDIQASAGAPASGPLDPAQPSSRMTSGPRTHTFVSAPNLRPPIITMSGKDTDPAAGDIFMDAQQSGQNAPYILNPHGALFWYEPTASRGSGPIADNVRVQSYRGQAVLTYWRGMPFFSPGGGRGVGLILNRHYQTIHTVTAGAGYERLGLNGHEFVLGHEGSRVTAFVTIWPRVRADLTPIGGPPRGKVFDCIIEEIDVATNKVLWEWHALGHVPISDTFAPYVPGQTLDYFHLNSIQQLANGHIIISARHTFAVYSIDKRTGKLDWELGGKHSSFKMGPGTHFSWQHDATLHKNGLLTVFDDGSGLWTSEQQSRALEIHLDFHAHRATLARAYEHSPATLANACGSVQVLPDGKIFVGWGSSPYFSEYSPGGRQLFGGSFVAPIGSYRAYRSNWVGRPLEPPAVAVTPATTAGLDDVYVSWNGATQVAKWQVLGSASATGPFAAVGPPVRWWSFETRIELVRANYYKVVALDASGHPLPHGTSAVVPGS